ncbi:MAG: exopolysaccharide biosynthesis polyprenyl glycosylphosphotransferase, partial [Campylobacterota bacterium]|nr:exopolysaccharide biosynthesis polyprenyl glycosylphosphotransferase [Campylobacterota bacterium]
NYSRLFIALYFIIGAFSISIAKRFVKKALFSLSFFSKKVLLVGNEEQINTLKNEFEENWYLGLKESKSSYDKVIIASKDMSTKDINEQISTFLNEKCELYIVPYITNINFVNSTIMEYSNIRYNAIQVENRLLITKNLWLKLIFDKLFAMLLLPLFLILHVVISIAIKFNSKGDSFFKQPRLGKDGSEFICYKYRTMYENSDEILQKYLKLNPEEVIYYDIFHKYKSDPRVTKVGKFLRSTSLDELPQFINILKGDMSLVGPRPYMCSESKKLGHNQNVILKVKPGITGLWQVSGRNHLTFKERNELEIWYIKNWSLWTDFVILVKTIKVVLLKVGAH